MANIYVGFHDRKNCSRILKPPGGGTSDIFNTSATENNDLKNTSLSSQENSPTKEIPCPLNGTELKTTADETEGDRNHQNGDDGPDDTQIPKIETLSVTDDDKTDQNQEKTDEEKKEAAEVKDTKSESISSLIHENQHKEKVTTTPEKKIGQRIPPGGYSSGLW